MSGEQVEGVAGEGIAWPEHRWGDEHQDVYYS